MTSSPAQDLLPQSVFDTFSMLGEKWTPRVLAALQGRTLRFNVLHREVDGISQKMLSLSLRQLERDGFVLRALFPVVPPRVEYTLSELGEQLLEQLMALGRMIRDRQPEVEASRRRFDELQEERKPRLADRFGFTAAPGSVASA